MKRVHLILTGLTLTIILLSINRLTNFTQNYLQPFEFLRWLDFNAMLPIPLMSIILYYLLKREIVYDSPFLKTGKYILLMVVLITGIYFFGAGSGDHEVTNYLNYRFCDQGKVDSPICNIIHYNDDEFSHYVYYVGFILMNVALMLIEYNLPRKNEVKKKDLVFFGSVMLLSIYLLLQKSYKKLPVTFYFGVAYTVGVVGTLLYKMI